MVSHIISNNSTNGDEKTFATLNHFCVESHGDLCEALHAEPLHVPHLHATMLRRWGWTNNLSSSIGTLSVRQCSHIKPPNMHCIVGSALARFDERSRIL